MKLNQFLISLFLIMTSTTLALAESGGSTGATGAGTSNSGTSGGNTTGVSGVTSTSGTSASSTTGTSATSGSSTTGTSGSNGTCRVTLPSTCPLVPWIPQNLTFYNISVSSCFSLPKTYAERCAFPTGAAISASIALSNQGGGMTYIVPRKFTRMRNMWLGDGECLDVVNDATKDKVRMVNCNYSSGQYWKRQLIVGNYFRFTPLFLEDRKSLDNMNDGTHRVNLAPSGNFSGQYWKLVPTQFPGYVKYKTLFQGEDRCLDMINDGENNKLVMATCGNYSGQFWKLDFN